MGEKIKQNNVERGQARVVGAVLYRVIRTGFTDVGGFGQLLQHEHEHQTLGQGLRDGVANGCFYCFSTSTVQGPNNQFCKRKIQLPFFLI